MDGSVAEFRKIEIKELKGTASGTGGVPAAPPQTVAGEPRAPLANAPSLAKRPASSPAHATTSTKGKFQPLFNGRNTAGWKVDPKQRGNWHVANGVLIGSGPSLSHLYTERGDYTDFHLRLEARFNQGGSSGVYLRCPFGPSLPSADDPKWPDGYEVTINNARIVHGITGGLYPGVDRLWLSPNPPRYPSDNGSLLRSSPTGTSSLFW